MKAAREALLLLLLLPVPIACGGDPRPPAEGRAGGAETPGGEAGGGRGGDDDKTEARALEKRVFQGIRYQTPAGTNVANSGVDRPSHYPDPETGEVVTIPTRIEPAISLTGQGPGGFYMVEIKKPPERTTLEGTISSLEQVPEASGFKGTPEADGWSLTYLWKSPDGSTTVMRHRHYTLADSDYDCVFDQGNTRDVATAAAICASITSTASGAGGP